MHSWKVMRAGTGKKNFFIWPNILENDFLVRSWRFAHSFYLADPEQKEASLLKNIQSITYLWCLCGDLPINICNVLQYWSSHICSCSCRYSGFQGLAIFVWYLIQQKIIQQEWLHNYYVHIDLCSIVNAKQSGIFRQKVFWPGLCNSATL